MLSCYTKQYNLSSVNPFMASIYLFIDQQSEAQASISKQLRSKLKELSVTYINKWAKTVPLYIVLMRTVVRWDVGAHVCLTVETRGDIPTSFQFSHWDYMPLANL